MLLYRRTKGSWPFSGASASPEGTFPRTALITLTVVFAIGTNVRLFQIGDSGAKATWQRVHLRSGGSPDRPRSG